MICQNDSNALWAFGDKVLGLYLHRLFLFPTLGFLRSQMICSANSCGGAATRPNIRRLQTLHVKPLSQTKAGRTKLGPIVITPPLRSLLGFPHPAPERLALGGQVEKITYAISVPFLLISFSFSFSSVLSFQGSTPLPTLYCYFLSSQCFF